MRARRWGLAATFARLVTAASAAGLLACGNGDDSSASVPAADAGAQTGFTGDGNTGVPICLDGGDAGMDATLTPYSACSSFTGGCVPFDPARVPLHPIL